MFRRVMHVRTSCKADNYICMVLCVLSPQVDSGMIMSLFLYQLCAWLSMSMTIYRSCMWTVNLLLGPKLLYIPWFCWWNIQGWLAADLWKLHVNVGTILAEMGTSGTNFKEGRESLCINFMGKATLAYSLKEILDTCSRSLGLCQNMAPSSSRYIHMVHNVIYIHKYVAR